MAGITVEKLRHQGAVSLETGKNSTWIAFSGKLFNAPALRELLKETKIQDFRDDGELIFALYQELGAGLLSHLDGVYAFALYDEKHGWLICRDPLGNEPLYISESKGQISLASEIKGIRELSAEYREFPIGSYYSSLEGWKEIPQSRVQPIFLTGEREIQTELQRLLAHAVDRMMGDENSVGVYLSGGLDSSIIAALATKQRKGLQTFSVGMDGSDDLIHARICAEYLGTDHQEYRYDLEEMLAVLPKVIYHLESYDAALVRSAVANYFLARLAGGQIQEVLSGEGADELFLGYEYLMDLSPSEVERESESLLQSLHHTALQRGDRMSQAFGIRPYTPFLDREVVRFARSIPAAIKLKAGKQEKWILREAFQGFLPESILYRTKKKFSAGAGSSQVLAQFAEDSISEEVWNRERITETGRPIASKEELLYYRLFKEYYPERSAELILGHTEHI